MRGGCAEHCRDGWGRRQTTVVAIDALVFTRCRCKFASNARLNVASDTQAQFLQHAIQRELFKVHFRCRDDRVMHDRHTAGF